MTVVGTKDCPPAAPARVPRLQQEWLTHARGQRVSVRLLDGKLLAGTLVGFDEYCLALALPDQTVPVLVYKHGISALVRQNGGDA